MTLKQKIVGIILILVSVPHPYPFPIIPVKNEFTSHHFSNLGFEDFFLIYKNLKTRKLKKKKELRLIKNFK